MHYDHVIRFGNGKYWAGGVGQYFLTTEPLRAFKDTKLGHENKIQRMLATTKGFPEGRLWATAELIKVED